MAPDLGAALAVAARAWVAETIGDREQVAALVAALADQAARDPGGPEVVARAVVGLWCGMAGQAGLALDTPVQVLTGEDGGPVPDTLWWAGELLGAHSRDDRDRVELLLSVWPAAGLRAAMTAVLDVAATVFLHALAPHTQA